MSLVNFDSESTRQKTSTTGGNSSRNNINNGWISDRFRQMSTKSSVNVDVALFWLHCYFWSICRHRFSGNICQPLNLLLPWIGLRENLSRKPWFPRQIYIKYIYGFPAQFSLGPIHWCNFLDCIVSRSSPSQQNPVSQPSFVAIMMLLNIKRHPFTPSVSL
jgi:hypothetical protein